MKRNGSSPTAVALGQQMVQSVAEEAGAHLKLADSARGKLGELEQQLQGEAQIQHDLETRLQQQYMDCEAVASRNVTVLRAICGDLLTNLLAKLEPRKGEM